MFKIEYCAEPYMNQSEEGFERYIDALEQIRLKYRRLPRYARGKILTFNGRVEIEIENETGYILLAEITNG